MTEYIDRGTLREILDGWRDAHADVDDVHGCGLLEDVICEVDAQTAADVAPVVRCKDCAHFIKNPSTYPILGNCVHLEMLMLENDFCSHGERRVRNGLK